MNNELYCQDIQTVIEKNPFLYEETDNTSFLITGANGLLGGALLDILSFLKQRGKQIQISVIVRDVHAFKHRVMGHKDFNVIQEDFSQKINFVQDCSYIIHAGANTHPALFAEKPVETLYGIFEGTRNMLDIAVKCKSKFLYVSSGEVYGMQHIPFHEAQKSILNSADSRSCYPVGKIAAENLCAAFSAEFSVPYNIVRPCHLYGPFFKSSDTHIFAEIIRRSSRQETLCMQSNGLQRRSLCHTLDCATAVLTVLLRGKNSETYNISGNEKAPSIRDVAEYCVKKGKSDIKFDLSLFENGKYSSIQNAILSSRKIQGIGWKPYFTWKKGFSHCIAIRRKMEV